MEQVIVTYTAEISVVVDTDSGTVVRVVQDVDVVVPADADVTWKEGGHVEPVPADVQEAARTIAETTDWPAWDRGW